MSLPKSVYLAGRMRGHHLYNFQAFAEAAITMRDLGIFVYSPAERDLASGFQPHLPTDHPDQVFNLEEAFAWDFSCIVKAEAIVLLPFWVHSDGTKKEIILAQGLGRGVYCYNSGLLEPAKIRIITQAVRED